MDPSTCPPNFLCMLSGVVMTTPVILIATGQYFELSVLSKTLRKNPLADPLTGSPINSNAMEIDFELQGLIEDYACAENELDVSSSLLEDDCTVNTVHHMFKSNHTSFTPSVPSAPGLDFSLSLLDDDSSDDESDLSTTDTGQRHILEAPPGFELRSCSPAVLSGDQHSCGEPNEKSFMPSKHDAACPPECKTTSPSLQKMDQFNLKPPPLRQGSPPHHQVPLQREETELDTNKLAYDYVEDTDTKLPPCFSTRCAWNSCLVAGLLKRDKNEYVDRKLLENTSAISQRAKALCRRTPLMWGYETDLKNSSRAIVNLMNSMSREKDQEGGGCVTRPGDMSPSSAGHRRQSTEPPGPRSTGGGGGSQMHREGGNTALHVAVWNGHLHVVECLVEAGASIDTKNAGSCTPLSLACSGGHVEIVEYLLSHGAVFKTVRKQDLCSQSGDAAAQKQITTLLNTHRRNAGMPYLR